MAIWSIYAGAVERLDSDIAGVDRMLMAIEHPPVPLAPDVPPVPWHVAVQAHQQLALAANGTVGVPEVHRQALALAEWGIPAARVLVDPNGTARTVPPVLALQLAHGLPVAGLTAIPGAVHEAAAVEGISGWAKLRRITLPMIRPTVVFATVLVVLTSVQVFRPDQRDDPGRAAGVVRDRADDDLETRLQLLPARPGLGAVVRADRRVDRPVRPSGHHGHARRVPA
ncbi:hypothetical protein ABT369_17325 [Dactylosporangium sp. NPDC000244]|uniref:hypothetical protein n=1 Tax=Dactylosporangium sp. NPDC000244 TaxID=3154365 RepID=UPI00331D1AC3